MTPRLGENNPNIIYTKYETPSAFRKAGAFLPLDLIKKGVYEYRLSPYMGCSKRCQYCFELHNEFTHENEVKIKTNTVSVLKSNIPSLDKTKAILLDGYDCEKAEQKERLIRSALKVIVEYGIPLLIQTKSDLVLRDLDLLEELNDSGVFVNVSFSMTSLNQDHARIFEPYTCSPFNRLEAMKKISDAGIHTGIILMPVLPFISDTKEELNTLFSRSAEKGCEYVIPELLRVTSSGKQRDMCFGIIRKHFPELVKRYEELYPARQFGPKFGSGPRDNAYRSGLLKRIGEVSRRYGLPTAFPSIQEPRSERRETISKRQCTLGSFL
jgi:DNA repair photolyase